ncbi:MAG: DUF4394 domain-containing protein [Deltaproteobacteria bacterium]|nr:MAG: DUF4394 domain-containing protein [Deltaproteobacteria bacterium]
MGRGREVRDVVRRLGRNRLGAPFDREDERNRGRGARRDRNGVRLAPRPELGSVSQRLEARLRVRYWGTSARIDGTRSLRQLPTPVRSSGLAVALVAIAATVRADPPPALIGSTEDGRLLLFQADRPEAARTVRPSGLSGRLVGIDSRPADGHLYGLTTSNDLYRIDPATGASTLVSTLTVPFDGDLRSGVAFNPQADRLRLVSADGQNLRVNVVLGATAVDTPLAYAPSDRNAGKRPRIAGAAYTNMVRDAPTTKLFEIDAEHDVLVLQDPPNDGLLTTIGALDADFASLSGFTIVTDAGGADRAYAATAGTLYTIDLTTGHATPVGPIGDPPVPLVSLAAVPGGRAP